MLKMTHAATLMDLSEDTKRPIKVLCEAMNSACCIYSTDFREVAELHEAGVGEKLAKSVYFLLCDSSYNVKCQSELEKHKP